MDPSGLQELFDEFLLEARERAAEVESLMLRVASGGSGIREAALAQVQRELHTLKGNAGMMGYGDLQTLAHRLEDEVEALDLDDPAIDPVLAGVDELRRTIEEIAAAAGEPAGEEPAESAPAAGAPAAGAPVSVVAPSASSVRLPFVKIDQLVEIQAETLIFRNRLSDAVRRCLTEVRKPMDDAAAFRQSLTAALEAVEEAREALEKTLNQLQEHVTELGMVPLQSLFHSLGRVVYDESRREGKLVDFEIHGGETPIDKTLLEAASEVLGHLVRNAVNHGVETPDVRRRRGKSEKGKVHLAAALEGSEVRIDVTDDGGGIDFEALRKKAGTRAIAGDVDDSPQSLLFAEGLSTREDADLGAGRGVGLSAVKRSVEAHSGRIDVFSERGKGTSFVLRLPLTTSILRSLLITADGEEYALPLSAVTESQRLEVVERHELNHAPVVPWRGRLVPLIDLGLAFGTAERGRETGYFVIIEVNGRHRGLAIDDIVGLRDIVVKGLDTIVGQPVGISGSTILGDGRVIMILDPHQLATIPPFIGAARGAQARHDRQTRSGKPG